MTYEQAMELVRSNPYENWTYFDEYGEYVLKSDLNLKIVCSSFEDKQDFFEDWAITHPDRSAHKFTYSIFYNGTRVDDFYLVAVDGFRANIPMPIVNTRLIPRSAYLLALAVDSLSTLDEYIQRSGLSIGD